jgi:hypothetical protein
MVRLLAPRDPLRCIPVRIASCSSETGPRLGGTAPEAVVPRQMLGHTRYFLTMSVVLDPPIEVSVFITEQRHDMYDGAGHIYHGYRAGPIEVVVHGPSTRGTAVNCTSLLSARPLLIGLEKDDWSDSDGRTGPEIRHKIGGRPRVLAAELASESEAY